MESYKLTFFNGRGVAEIIRLIFAAAEKEYKDVRIERHKWSALKPSTPFGQIPILEIDGKAFCQSYAIGRYLARKFNLAGKTDLEELRTDMIVDCVEDGIQPFLSLLRERDEEKKAAMKKTMSYSEEQLPAAYANLEKILESNNGGDGFFVGDDLTWADLAFQVFASWGKVGGNEAVLDKYPKLKALEKRVESMPTIATWIAKRPVSDF